MPQLASLAPKIAHYLANDGFKKMPPEQLGILQNFYTRFPIDQLAALTLEKYGSGKPDGFCYWLEHATKSLAGIASGTTQKFGVWKSVTGEYRVDDNVFKQRSPAEAFATLKSGLLSLIGAARRDDLSALDNTENPFFARRLVRGKLIYLYFPDKHIPVFSIEHLYHFLDEFGVPHGDGDLFHLNRRLIQCPAPIPDATGIYRLRTH